jgi:hypothetical protein
MIVTRHEQKASSEGFSTEFGGYGNQGSLLADFPDSSRRHNYSSRVWRGFQSVATRCYAMDVEIVYLLIVEELS